jgi:hypothetical protein
MNPTCKNLLPQHLLSGYIQPKPLTWPLKESRSQAYTRTGARSHHFVCFLRAPSSSSWIDTKKQGGSDPQIAKMGGNLFLPPTPTTPFSISSSYVDAKKEATMTCKLPKWVGIYSYRPGLPFLCSISSPHCSRIGETSPTILGMP